MDIVQAINTVLQTRPIGIESSTQSKFKEEKTQYQQEQSQEVVFSKEELQKKVDEINEYVLGFNAQFSFKVHEGTGRTFVRLIDMQTHDIIKEIPPEKMMDVVAGIWDLMGIVVDRKE
ncbi:flagellar protein FlaG [Carnobacterium iners]|uniref:Flagellar protein FlaG n=2 Tax=Carnobacterium iners TaxID=1073423 RepID=A0A1X7N2A7_9LACT|nr:MULTISPECIES: flagellar protein FlaG [Carnobacterium]SEK21537.1 flagellar protein FlaG [Carnobacterium iners]SMH30574.1 flagellar protein FlaG [Carnobacterium iners]